MPLPTTVVTSPSVIIETHITGRTNSGVFVFGFVVKSVTDQTSQKGYETRTRSIGLTKSLAEHTKQILINPKPLTKATMRTVSTLCLYRYMTVARGFTAPPATSRRPASTAMNMFSVDIIQSLPFDLPTLPGAVDCTKAIECAFPDECPLPEECPIDMIPEEFGETIFDSPLSRIGLILFDEGDVVKEEVENGLTHAMLDFGSFWDENAVLIKGMAVLGRIYVLLQNFAPGHGVLPDDLAFQLGFLGLACNSLYHTIKPKMELKKTSLLMTSRDRLAFRSAFRSAGFSWQQFREVNLQSMEWVTVKPGQVILDEASDADAVFWLYQGDIMIQSEDKTIHSISAEDRNKGTCMGLIGEKLLAALGHGNDKDVSEDKSKAYLAGESGATLLRMDMPKLKKFLKHNNEMSSNFGSLAFNVMQNKLKALRMETK